VRGNTQQNVVYSIIDANGALVETKTIDLRQYTDGVFSIDVSHVSASTVLFVVISVDNQNFQHKIYVE